ncbi:MAG TPA: glycoside hydrolase family 27 protein, partial [Solirubrobacteraceae bacterium]
MRQLCTALASTMLALVLGASSLPAVATAAPSLGWSAVTAFDSGNTPSGVSCASESLCVAVDHQGNVLSTSNPTASHPSWSIVATDEGKPLDAVSCVTGGPCVAVDDRGDALVNSGSSASAWSPPTPIDGGSALTGVSCASRSLCVAVNEAGDVLSNTNPGTGGWSVASVDAGHRLTGASCPSQSLCVTIDDSGNVLSSTNPTGGSGGWHSQKVTAAQLVGVSCSTAGPCLAIDNAGNALASSDSATSAATWSETPIDGEALSAISCAPSGLCVAADGHGQALASDDPATPIPTWTASSADSESIAGISCLSGGFCLAVDPGGNFIVARVPAPAATTLAPTSLTDTSATLAGFLDPNDATLGACSFEYGIALPYTQSVPCSALPTATGGAQGVSGQLSGLSPNTVYHYRLLASSPAGTSAGADVTFTTAVSSQVALVYPRPSIGGTPAVGQRLTCHPGTPTGTTARLSYAWARDLIPIPEATATTYTVKGQDSGHHLQCQVTATDGGGSATEKSAFVTIPVGGAPASVGETAVGKATYRAGKLSVPVFCSAQASGGCEVTVRLAAVETLSDGRVVAVAAESRRDAHKSTTGVRHVTVTLASVTVRLAAGSHRTLIATPNSSARRLLASRRHFTAYVYVSGTVIGVIQAQLAKQLIALGAAARGASAHAMTLGASGWVAPPRNAALDLSTSNATIHPATAGRPADARASAARVLAATPYMGWDTYFALGGKYSEATVLQQASQLISLGLSQRGYRYVWLDVGWWHGTRAANGQIVVSSTQWPHGMRWLASTLHSAGLRVGLYTDAGSTGCGGSHQGSYGHYQQDINTFAAWGFDAVKVDFCGGVARHLQPKAAYTAIHQAILRNASHRPMLLSICDFPEPGQIKGEPSFGDSAFSSYTFGPSVGNSWRTDTDVGSPGYVTFQTVLRNLDADATHPEAAGPGHWNDPDYLGPDQGLSEAQFATQFSMWAMLAAPLMISGNLISLSSASATTVSNRAAIAI